MNRKEQRILVLFIILTAVVTGFVLSGIVTTRAQTQIENRISLRSPEIVGETEDGLEVKRYVVKVPHGIYDHYLYVVKGKTTITDNHLVPVGKSVMLQTTATAK